MLPVIFPEEQLQSNVCMRRSLLAWEKGNELKYVKSGERKTENGERITNNVSITWDLGLSKNVCQFKLFPFSAFNSICKNIPPVETFLSFAHFLKEKVFIFVSR